MPGFDDPVRLSRGEPARFPGGLDVRFLGGGHKRPATGGPQCEFVDLEVKAGGRTESFRLNHVVEPDGRERWDSRRCGPCRIELRAVDPAGTPTIVVLKDP